MIGNICSKSSGGKPLNSSGKTSETHLKILGKNNAQTPKFIGSEKLAVGVCQVCRSTARSTANGQKSDRWGCGRPPGRPNLWNRESESLPVDRPVDRGISREQTSLDGRLGRSTGPPARTGVHVCARRSTAPVDRLQPQSTWSVD